MKCLSLQECSSWLVGSGLRMGADNSLERVAEANLKPTGFVVTANRNLSAEIFRQVLDWLPPQRERLLVVSEWRSYPPDEQFIFEAMRRGCGAERGLDDAPGHLFCSTKAADTWYDDRPAIDVAEESLAMWLVSLMQQWTWLGFAIAKDSGDAILLGDGYFQFISDNDQRRSAAEALIGELGLVAQPNFPWQ